MLSQVESGRNRSHGCIAGIAIAVSIDIEFATTDVGSSVTTSGPAGRINASAGAIGAEVLVIRQVGSLNFSTGSSEVAHAPNAVVGAYRAYSILISMVRLKIGKGIGGSIAGVDGNGVEAETRFTNSNLIVGLAAARHPGEVGRAGSHVRESYLSGRETVTGGDFLHHEGSISTIAGHGAGVGARMILPTSTLRIATAIQTLVANTGALPIKGAAICSTVTAYYHYQRIASIGVGKGTLQLETLPARSRADGFTTAGIHQSEATFGCPVGGIGKSKA